MNGEMIDAEKLKQLQQIEQMKRQLMTSILAKEAFERLGRIRTVNPDLAGQLELYLIQLYQAATSLRDSRRSLARSQR
jgi:DNA-binding TFAR19-related protein (PDSD5 family)